MPSSNMSTHGPEFPLPRPWNERDPAMRSIKGDRSYIIDYLVKLLELIGDGVHKDETIAWPGWAEQTRVGAAVGPISDSGLFLREGARVALSSQGKQWLESKDPQFLIAIFHSNVRFFGEILNELANQSISTRSLLKVAQTKYGFGWTTAGPIYDRTKWLEAAGLVKIFSHKVHLSDEGRRFLAMIQVYEPQSESSSPADLQPPPEPIAEQLAKLAQGEMTTRSRAAGFYIPGMKTHNGQIESIRAVVETCASPTRGDVLELKAASVFQTGPVAAENGIRTLGLLGLLERVSSTEYAATQAGLAWLASTYPIDLARIAHANVWYFGEIIKELEEYGPLAFSQILASCSKYSASGRFGAMKRGGLTARIALLEAIGLIVHVSNHMYKPTDLGIAFRKSVRCIERSNNVEYDSKRVGGEAKTDARTDRLVAENLGSSRTFEEIADEIESAAKRIATPEDFEKVAVEAFNKVGLPAEHIGGRDDTDGLLRNRPGQLGKLITLETKTAADGILSEERAKPATLSDHRRHHNADSTVILGPGFERKFLDVLDGDPYVAVVSSHLLAETVRRQVNTPLTPEELGPLLDPSVREIDRRGLLQERWKEKEQWACVMRGVVDLLAREADSPLPNDDSSSLDLGWLTAGLLRRSLRDTLGTTVPEDQILDVLSFLALPWIAVVEQVQSQYRLRIPVTSVRQRLDSFGQRWELGKRILDGM